jgi:hypothetical protein
MNNNFQPRCPEDYARVLDNWDWLLIVKDLETAKRKVLLTSDEKTWIKPRNLF